VKIDSYPKPCSAQEWRYPGKAGARIADHDWTIEAFANLNRAPEAKHCGLYE